MTSVSHARHAARLLALAATLLPTTASGQSLPLVHLTDEGLTIAAHDVPLGALLKAVAGEAGFKLGGATGVDTPVTVRFRRQPLIPALRTLLGHQRHAMVTRLEADQTIRARDRISELYLYPTPPRALSRVELVLARQVHRPDPPPVRVAPSEHRVWRWQRLLEGDDAEQRAEAALAWLRDRDPVVRVAAARALARWNDDAAVPFLELALRDPSTRVQVEAILALRRLGGERAARGLTGAIHDRDRRVRRLAVEALGALGGQAAAELLRYVGAVDRDQALRITARLRLSDLDD